MASSKTPLDMAVLPTAVAVCSESDPDTVYQVQLPYCPCPDFRWRRANAGALASVDPQRLFCKHLVTALDRVAGWHRRPEPPEESVTYRRVTRAEAVTRMTSAYLASDLVDQLLHAALAASPWTVSENITTGTVLVDFDPKTRRYTITLPGAQPTNFPSVMRG